MIPVQIKVAGKLLNIKWNDNSESHIKLADLRRNCPCAVCAAERAEQSDSYVPIYSDEQLSVKKIEVVGNYAIGISWKDEHNTGIYIFDQLKKLSG